MGLLDKLFGGSKAKEPTPVIDVPPCTHMTLVPRWDNAEDMCDYSKASDFTCESCGEKFTAEQGLAMREAS